MSWGWDILYKLNSLSYRSGEYAFLRHIISKMSIVDKILSYSKMLCNAWYGVIFRLFHDILTLRYFSCTCRDPPSGKHLYSSSAIKIWYVAITVKRRGKQGSEPWHCHEDTGTRENFPHYLPIVGWSKITHTHKNTRTHMWQDNGSYQITNSLCHFGSHYSGDHISTLS